MSESNFMITILSLGLSALLTVFYIAVNDPNNLEKPCNQSSNIPIMKYSDSTKPLIYPETDTTVTLNH